jgi:hypothetical protein
MLTFIDEEITEQAAFDLKKCFAHRTIDEFVTTSAFTQLS